MIEKDFQCAYCGLKGEMARDGFDAGQGVAVFRWIGRNPYSGHLHYQCPSCGIVLLVQPPENPILHLITEDLLNAVACLVFHKTSTN